MRKNQKLSRKLSFENPIIAFITAKIEVMDG
jgi:hypothetical protein